MKTTTKVPLIRQGVIFFFLSAFLLFLTPAVALSQTSNNGKAIKDAVTGLLDKTATVTNNLGNLCDINCQSTNAGKVFKNNLDQLKQDQQRAQNANARAKASDYHGVVRERGKKKSEGCDPEVQVCSAPSTSTFTTASSASSKPQFDDAEGKDLVDTIDEAGNDLDQLNEALSTNTQQTSSAVYAATATATGLHSAQYNFAQYPGPKLALVAFWADQASEKTKEIADHLCKQTWVALGEGGNTSALCVGIVVAHAIVDTAYQFIQFKRSDSSSAQITGTYERAADIYNEVAATSGDVTALKTEIDTLKGEVEQMQKNQAYILQLLATPQGQRPGFAK